MRTLLASACSLLLAATPALAQPTPSPGPVPWRAPAPQEIRGHVDWQGHPAMHVPYGFFKRGLSDKAPRKRLTWRHQLKQTLHAEHLRKSGVRIFVAAAVAAEKARNTVQARTLILQQIAFVNAFVRDNQSDFALATTPAEARRVLTTTRKIVIVHAIEGARWVLNSQADADYWASKGVMMVTLVHLRDDEFGGAAINTGFVGPLLNLKGAWRRTRKSARGLTAQGRQAIVWLAKAGVLVDLTHMSPRSVREALELTAREGIPPLVTHGWARSIRNDERSFSDAQIVEIYRQGGCFQIPLNGAVLDPIKPSVPIPDGLRPGTLDSFDFHYTALDRLLKRNVATVFPGARSYASLTSAQKTQLTIGWASDWNGFTNHSKPTHPGRRGKRALKRGALLEVDALGLAHPGLLPQYWQRLRERGLDLDPLLRQPEQLLRVWTRIRAWKPRTP